MPRFSERLNKPKARLSAASNMLHVANGPGLKSGVVIFDMYDPVTGQKGAYFEKKNVITLDADIAAAMLFSGDLDYGVSMLAVGTGATGNILSPDAPQNTQRALNNEIERKAFASSTYRTSEGVAVDYPTPIVDFTTVFSESEAVGALNEMALIVPASLNPAETNPIENGPDDYDATIDVTGFDLLVNYFTFAVVSKPSSMVLSVTWRVTI